MTERPSSLQSRSRATHAPGEADLRDQLARVLGRLQAPLPAVSAGAEGRCVLPEAPLGLSSAILSEIDATVMARSLAFAAPDGASLRLDVSNRRLLHFALSDATGNCLVSGGLTYAGQDALDALYAALETVCSWDALHVTYGPPSGPVGLEQAGVTVATLRQAFAALSRPDPFQDPHALGAFLTASAGLTRAHMRADGAGGGEASLAAPLLQALETWLGGVATATLPRAMLISAEDDAVPALFLAAAEDDAIALALEPRAEEDVLKAWWAFAQPR
ncbi:MAG: hypothetical protein AAF865_13735 [Pseudomonadota bacterium]